MDLSFSKDELLAPSLSLSPLNCCVSNCLVAGPEVNIGLVLVMGPAPKLDVLEACVPSREAS